MQLIDTFVRVERREFATPTRLLAALAICLILVFVMAGNARSVAGSAVEATGKSFNLATDNLKPRAIWSDGTTMWVSDLSGRLFAYTLATGDADPDKDIATLANAGNRHGKGLWSDNTTIWVSDDADNKVYAYNLDTGTRDTSKEFDTWVGLNYYPRGLWSNGTTIWVSDPNADGIYAYDLSTGSRQSEMDIEGLREVSNDRATGLWSNGDTIWVVDFEDARIYAYDLSSKTRQRGRDLKGLTAHGNDHPKGVWSDDETMWVLDSKDRKVYAYDFPGKAVLNSLEVSGVGHLNFRPFTTSYTVQAPSGLAQTTIIATPEFSDATVTISPTDADTGTVEHQVDLVAGENTITVTVTSGSTTKVYTVVVERTMITTLTSDANLSDLTLAGITLDSFASDQRDYSVAVANGVSATAVTTTLSDSNATLSITPVDSDTAEGHQVALIEGRNVIRVIVTSSDESRRKTYRVIVNRDSADAYGWVPTEDFSTEVLDPSSAPFGMWSDATTVWVSDINDRKVYAFNASTRDRDASKDRVIRQSHPNGIWSNGTTLWVVRNHAVDKIFAYNLATGARESNNDFTTLHDAGQRFARDLWSDGTTMWVSEEGGDKVYAYNLATKQPDPSKDVSLVGANGDSYGIWSDSTTIWVSDSSDDKLYAYNLSTNAREPSKDFDSLPQAGNNSPIQLWSDGTYMWVIDQTDSHIYAYNMPS